MRELAENLSAVEKPVGPRRRDWWAYVGPFGLFNVLMVLPGAVKLLPAGAPPPLWVSAPEFWVYPLQTLLCAAMLFAFRREYPFGNRSPGALAFGVLIGVVALLLWLSPQMFFHFPPRIGPGFDPTRLRPGSVAYFWSVALRFVRLVVVVPLLEEVFWRGFLLRYLVREDFTGVAFGTFTRLSFGAVAVGFMLEHTVPDYAAALATGLLYNWVAVRTRSLPVCVVAHAVTNLLLGVYIMNTRQWGFW